MLGHKLCQELPKHGHEVTGTLRSPTPQLVELLDGVELIDGVDAFEPGSIESTIAGGDHDFVINAIGLVKQFDESSNKYMATAINAWLPHRLARACRESGSRLIHMSTDCVFSGRKGSYTEDDPSDAEDLYGRSKYLGEPDDDESAALTIRSSIIGRELHNRTHGLVEWFLSERGNTIKGFSCAIYSGFSTIEMARIMDVVMQRAPELSGVHQVASTPIDKFELLNSMKDASGLDIQVNREEEFVCDRSLVTGSSFGGQTGYVAPAWSEMLETMFADPTPYDSIRAAAVS